MMPIGNRTVLIGMSERTTGQMIEKIALSLFAAGAADRVIAAGMSRDRAHMHLDTVFTFLYRDCVTLFPSVVDSITAILTYVDAVPGRLYPLVPTLLDRGHRPIPPAASSASEY